MSDVELLCGVATIRKAGPDAAALTVNMMDVEFGWPTQFCMHNQHQVKLEIVKTTSLPID